MTKNQIDFYKAREEKRKNLTSEAQRGAELDESKRHSLAQEATNWYEADTNRMSKPLQAQAAMAQAQVSGQRLAEDIRHNIVGEGLQRKDVETRARGEDTKASTLAESIRHNLVTEGETSRHNVQSEAISKFGEQTKRSAQESKSRLEEQQRKKTFVDTVGGVTGVAQDILDLFNPLSK